MFFTIVLSSQFPNPYVFAAVLARFGLGVAQWIAAWAADFSHKSMQQIGERRNLVFCSIFLSVSKTPMEFSRFICFMGAVLGPPLSRPQNRRFHNKTLIAGSHFQKPDQIEISGMFEGFRCARNLVKCMIRGMFYYFEMIETS